MFGVDIDKRPCSPGTSFTHHYSKHLTLFPPRLQQQIQQQQHSDFLALGKPVNSVMSNISCLPSYPMANGSSGSKYNDQSQYECKNVSFYPDLSDDSSVQSSEYDGRQHLSAYSSNRRPRDNSLQRSSISRRFDQARLSTLNTKGGFIPKCEGYSPLRVITGTSDTKKQYRRVQLKDGPSVVMAVNVAHIIYCI